jgi:ribosomal protein S18 acetylase RimI-like enzyme
MAALSEADLPPLEDLRSVRAEELDPLLDEETGVWSEALDWDFSASADLVRRFVRMSALSGYALRLDGEIAGYAYFVCEESKGLIGDLYIRRAWRSAAREDRLLEAALGAMSRSLHVRRVEAQLMLLPDSLRRRPVYAEYARMHPRHFMAIEAGRAASLVARPPAPGIRIEPWTGSRQEEAAALIAEAYRGHIDGEINDQYRSLAGARRFLTNIVQYPGCGIFSADASFIAAGAAGGLAGLCLASSVSSGVGHITQVCVSPRERGRALGYELLRRSLASLARLGCRKASLTVTGTNEPALRLYERMGFATVCRFGAYVWEGFR